MNKLFSFFVVFFFVTGSSNAQFQPENPGFENWEDVGLDVDEPVEWSSIKTSDNSFLNGLAPYVWDQSTDAHTGSFSVKLYNQPVLTLIAAGALTNGRFHAELDPDNAYAFTDINNSQWNTPLNKKPDSVAVWVKHFPAGTDVAQVKAVLHTGYAEIPDPAFTNWVASAEINITDETTSWTRFSAPFNYLNGNTPEYILFVINSAGTVATNGTETYFDDLELIYNPVVLDLTAYLEGPYEKSGLMNIDLNPDQIPLNQPYNTAPWNYSGDESVAAIPTDVVDWVLIEVRDAPAASNASSLTSKGRQAAFIRKDGAVVGLDGTSNISFEIMINQKLFVIIWHRNHLGIMSAYELTETDGIYEYNFGNAADKIYGSPDGNILLETGYWGMIGGNGDGDDDIDSNDKTGFWSILVGKKGYLSGDYDLNEQINNKDKNEIWNNNLNRESQVPD